MSNKGIKLTEEHKRKIAIAHLGIIPNEKSRKKMSIAQKLRFARNGGYWLGKKRDNSWFKGKKQSDEHKKKMVETRRKNGSYHKFTPEERLKRKNNPNLPRGENHHKWKGGITSQQMKIRNSLDMKIWREAIFKRDDWRCKNCNIRGGRLNAHHIKPFALYPELRFAIDNGVTLCWECHKKTPTFGGRVETYKLSLSSII